MNRTMQSTVVAAVFAAAGLATGLAMSADADSPVPACEEDEVVQGVGDYTPDGQWTSYQCAHPDVLTSIRKGW